MSAVAALSASTLAAASFRNSPSLRSWKPVWRAMARSGQSSCKSSPLAAMAVYSGRIALTRSARYASWLG